MTNQQAAVLLPLLAALLAGLMQIGSRRLVQIALMLGVLAALVVDLARVALIAGKDLLLIEIVTLCVRLMSDEGKDALLGEPEGGEA
jgi:hypothetical protein